MDELVECDRTACEEMRLTLDKNTFKDGSVSPQSVSSISNPRGGGTASTDFPFAFDGQKQCNQEQQFQLSILISCTAVQPKMLFLVNP